MTRTTTIRLGAVATLLLAVPGAVGQEINPDSLVPPESVRLGSIQQRSPGRFIRAAVSQHQEFAGRAFRGPHGEPQPEDDADDPGFYGSIIAEVLDAFFSRLALVLFGQELLDDLTASLGDVLAPPETAGDATAEETTADADEEVRARVRTDAALSQAFRQRNPRP